ncbi:MAG: hypothetical protein HY721_07210 [Planctomycetes bacterium]|nr:hypothetical protein [Planctomycetota bacterium]
MLHRRVQRFLRLDAGLLLLAALTGVLPGGLRAQEVPCLRLIRQSFHCDAANPGQYAAVFQVQNQSGHPVDRLFLWAGSAGITLSPDEWILAPVPSGGFSGPLTLAIAAPPGAKEVCVEASAHESSTGSCCAGRVACVPLACGEVFQRGDANTDGKVDISDGINILNYLFLGGPETTCFDAADTTDDGLVDISDGIRLFNYLFLGGPAPPAPGPDACGPDPSEDGLNCGTYTRCG